MSTLGSFVGIGVGPGDPELLTLKAASLIEHAPVVAYLANEQGVSQAKKIACIAMERRYSSYSDVVIPMPMSMDRTKANVAYDQGAKEIALHLKQGRNVAFLCEGDPLFFGSFTYLMERLEDSFNCQVVPGISSVNAAASALKHPLTVLKESFAVVSGRHSDSDIQSALEQHDSVVIMKAGSARPRILEALRRTDRLLDAKYLEYIGRENEHIVTDVRELIPSAGPYFSLFVVTRHDRDSR
ncbi:precorrin-2 C(20)-methyltransferase [Marinomonas mediterranea]|jgi:precorrin-2 C20-methyltransferase|uniref:Precorrin-2 C20-methyltransferase n=1 Tax=Marinomonas mediterranea (strain ATCC 700492 / JCM 21426 / NBRC 103028 / MMB-1) TaxID=717774 RepID=F2JUU9_MARM1|nr:precorrin-2 C(20)-methyltransferase [Marinomonas mediterranea]ADZ90514.1 precorrin-2 C20-methyltransferase [Marinomonas mediterranea MMB-1]WCN08567.1 precorrin-2 C(20)-methyltransferase [Marinomonas mediterranea]WCN16693.1 precorrin-2 C(20)-methyltransferase [Marinomonas mediterranea MMB-1]